MNPNSSPVFLRSLEEKVRPGWVALLIIDMCNDFIHPDGKAAARAQRPIQHAQAVIPPMQRLLHVARAAGVMIVFGQHTTLPGNASDSGPWLDARSRATYSVADLCMDGSWGQQIIDELAPVPTDLILKKYRYSAFAGTSLDLLLRSASIKTAICCGVSTNVCVESTAREAFSNDYYVVIPADACASWDANLHEAALASARHRYATVCTTDDLARAWGVG